MPHILPSDIRLLSSAPLVVPKSRAKSGIKTLLCTDLSLVATIGMIKTLHCATTHAFHCRCSRPRLKKNSGGHQRNDLKKENEKERGRGGGRGGLVRGGGGGEKKKKRFLTHI